MRRWSPALLPVVLAACAGTAPPPPALPPPSPVRAPAAPLPPAVVEDGLALYERLVAMARRYHVFAPATEKNLGARWDALLPRLRAEFAAAKGSHALGLALFHFGNSLRDVHCQYRPAQRGDRLRLPLRVRTEVASGTRRFYVDRLSDPALSALVVPGDLVVSVDGVPAEGLLEAHTLVSNMNSVDNLAEDVATYLTSRRTSTTDVLVGARSEWVVRPRAGGEPRSFTVVWKTPAQSAEDGDTRLDFEARVCFEAEPRDYGHGYALVARGYRSCIYTSSEPVHRDYPIVRHVSFRYDELPHGPLVDHELVRSLLVRARPKGVLLDLQDNGGGINPNLFLDWWADKPYEDTYTRVVLDASLLRDERGEGHLGNSPPAVRAWYEDALKQRLPDQRMTAPRPFMCTKETCSWDNHYVPAHRVTRAPVALLLGPNCASSCDAFAYHFDRDDLGPIVGRPAMAGYTTHRARFDVAARAGTPPLGTIEFAVSYDTSDAASTSSIEGKPVTVDVPIARTFENASTYDADLVSAAITALATRVKKR